MFSANWPRKKKTKTKRENQNNCYTARTILFKKCMFIHRTQWPLATLTFLTPRQPFSKWFILQCQRFRSNVIKLEAAVKLNREYSQFMGSLCRIISHKKHIHFRRKTTNSSRTFSSLRFSSETNSFVPHQKKKHKTLLCASSFFIVVMPVDVRLQND